ncbi:MAG: hypothetical protein PWQ70_3212 [Clostridiales bacterium]|nr:hypothetical protein [Clostridiales bacterium]
MKHEEIYLKEYQNFLEARINSEVLLRHYDHKQPYQNLGDKAPYTFTIVKVHYSKSMLKIVEPIILFFVTLQSKK